MNRKIIKFSFAFALILLLCTACNGTITRNIRHAGFSMADKFVCDEFYPADKEDTSYKKIRYFTDTHLIDTSGKIYELSLAQVYQNKQNCKVANTNITVRSIFNNSIIKATDDKYYYLLSSNNVSSYSEVPETDNSYFIYDLLLKASDVIKVATANSSTGQYYVLKTDGNVYSYVISRADYNTLPAITSISIVYNKNDFDSDIVDFNYAGDSTSTFIKTENKIYRAKVTNTECLKYADITCNYKLEEDEIFEEYKDKIIMYNGKMLITDYKQVFTINS